MSRKDFVRRFLLPLSLLAAAFAPGIGIAQPLIGAPQREQTTAPQQKTETTQDSSQQQPPSQNVRRQTTPQLPPQAIESASRLLEQTGTIQDIEKRLTALEERPMGGVTAAEDTDAELLANLRPWFRRWWLWGLFWGFLWWIPWIVFSWQWWRRRFWVFWWPWPWWWWIPWLWFIPWLLWAWWWPFCFWFWWCWFWWWIPWIFWIPWWLIILKHVLQWLHAKKP